MKKLVGFLVGFLLCFATSGFATTYTDVLLGEAHDDDYIELYEHFGSDELPWAPLLAFDVTDDGFMPGMMVTGGALDFVVSSEDRGDDPFRVTAILQDSSENILYSNIFDLGIHHDKVTERYIHHYKTVKDTRVKGHWENGHWVWGYWTYKEVPVYKTRTISAAWDERVYDNISIDLGALGLLGELDDGLFVTMLQVPYRADGLSLYKNSNKVMCNTALGYNKRKSKGSHMQARIIRQG